MVKFFIDSSKINEIKEFKKWGVFSGVTTNQKILADDGCKDKEEMKERIIEIAELAGPTSIEVFATDTEGMVKEAEEYASWHENIVVKIPANEEGLKAISILKKRDIKTNFTACISPTQAILGAMAGATYVSFFYGRIGDCGFDPDTVINSAHSVFFDYNTKIIVGSIRSLLDVIQSIKAGADIITITPPILKKLIENAKTKETVKEFLDSWK